MEIRKIEVLLYLYIHNYMKTTVEKFLEFGREYRIIVVLVGAHFATGMSSLCY